MIWLKNQVYTGANKRQSLFDVCYIPAAEKLPVVVFAHGYKGFKDWGCWDLVAESFAKQGFLFLKFNFSHNGGTVNEAIDFPDLEAFAKNCYSYELNDISTIIDMVASSNDLNGQLIDNNQVNLIGHSRGGGMALLYAAQSNNLNTVTTWAAVSDFESRFTNDINRWKEDGVFYVTNGRTRQQMPHNYSFYEDFIVNKQQLDIPSLLKNINQPTLVIHGEADDVVLKQEGEFIANKIIRGNLQIIPKANHTFGAVHPWNNKLLPEWLSQTVEKTILFITSFDL